MLLVLAALVLFLAMSLRARIEGSTYAVDGQRDALWSPEPLACEMNDEAQHEPPALGWASALWRYFWASMSAASRS